MFYNLNTNDQHSLIILLIMLNGRANLYNEAEHTAESQNDRNYRSFDTFGSDQLLRKCSKGWIMLHYIYCHSK